MIEGKKISQLVTVSRLQDGCCFPVLSKGATKRITFSSLVESIIARLPEIDLNEIEGIKTILQEHETEIDNVLNKCGKIDESVEDMQAEIDALIKDTAFQIDGQNKTLYEYVLSVKELKRIYEQASITGGVVDRQLSTESTHPVQNKVLAELIPAQAGATNQLADKDFVNSSIATNTAYPVGTFNSLEELEGYSGELTNNDYAYVITTDETENRVFKRYKWNDRTSEWKYEYDLNTTGFTAEQWAAINSGVTEESLKNISSLPMPEGKDKLLMSGQDEETHELEWKQVDKSEVAGYQRPVDKVEDGNLNAVTSNAVNNALTELKKIKKLTVFGNLSVTFNNVGAASIASGDTNWNFIPIVTSTTGLSVAIIASKINDNVYLVCPSQANKTVIINLICIGI